VRFPARPPQSAKWVPPKQRVNADFHILYLKVDCAAPHFSLAEFEFFRIATLTGEVLKFKVLVSSPPPTTKLREEKRTASFSSAVFRTNPPDSSPHGTTSPYTRVGPFISGTARHACRRRNTGPGNPRLPPGFTLLKVPPIARNVRLGHHRSRAVPRRAWAPGGDGFFFLFFFFFPSQCRLGSAKKQAGPLLVPFINRDHRKSPPPEQTTGGGANAPFVHKRCRIWVNGGDFSKS